MSLPLEFRKPRASDWGVCRMLLPDTISDAAARDYLLAIDPVRHTVAGAICFRDDGAKLEHLRLHVVPGYRRSGVGRQLVKEVIREAARRNRSEVTGRAMVNANPDLHSFLLENGFIIKATLFIAEGRMASGLAHWQKIRNGAIDHLPSSVQIVPLSESLAKEAGRLYAEYIAHAPEQLSARVFFSGDIPRFQLTQILLIDGKAEGMILVEQNGATAIVHARIVTAANRQGRASAVLAGATIERLHQAGIQTLRFQFFDTTHDTFKLSKRLETQIVDSLDQLSFAVAKV